MLDLSINTFNTIGMTFFQNKSFEFKNDISKRIAFVALVALGCVIAVYVINKCLENIFFPPQVPYKSPAPSFHYTTVPKSFPTSIPYSFEKKPVNSTYSLTHLQNPTIIETKENPTPPIETFSTQNVKQDLPVLQFQTNFKTKAEKLEALKKEQGLVKLIKKKWLDNDKQEINRIINAKILPSLVEKALLQPSLTEVYQKHAVIGKVLELKNLYKHSHYVFTHGQASQISMVSHVMDECLRTFSPHWHHPLRIPFRLPHTIIYSENANEFITKYDAVKPSFKDDGFHSDKMISVDAQFWHDTGYESAQYFFSNGTNIAYSDDAPLTTLFKSTFLNYFPHDLSGVVDSTCDSICTMLAEKALKIAKQRRLDTKVGVLYAICIPKNIIDNDTTNFAYPCHAYGRTCNCFPNQRIKKLEDMQGDTPVICTANSSRTQYRILTSRLTEEPDVRIFAIDALSKIQRKHYRNQVKKLVSELSLYSHLADMIERIDDEPWLIEEITSLKESTQMDEKYIKLLLDTKKIVISSAQNTEIHDLDYWATKVD